MTGPASDLPFVTTGQMREVDRAMVEDFGIELLQMMEHAGRHLARLAAQRFLSNDPRGRQVLVLAGRGGNGGGGLVAARRLHMWGAHVRVMISAETDAFSGVPAKQLAILRSLAVPIDVPSGAQPRLDADLVIDAVIGYSLAGHAHDPSVRATATLTLALPKTGLRTDPGRGHAGELYLADIGVPPELYSRPPLNLEVGHIFAREEIIRLW